MNPEAQQIQQQIAQLQQRLQQLQAQPAQPAPAQPQQFGNYQQALGNRRGMEMQGAQMGQQNAGMQNAPKPMQIGGPVEDPRWAAMRARGMG